MQICAHGSGFDCKRCFPGMEPVAATGEPLEWAELWAAMDASPDAWTPTTEAMYWQMVVTMPTRAKRSDGAFLMGQPVGRTPGGIAVYAGFKQVDDKFFARNLTVDQFVEGV